MTTASSGESALGDLIRDEIAATGPMPFAGFMARALYHPTLGYYAGGGCGREPLGWEGDYVTSGDLHPLWGWSLARQLHQMWELLGQPVVFDVLEAGAGRGLLAAAVWRYARELAPGWLPALRYTLVDSAPLDSPLRRTREQGLASALAALDVPVHATRWASTIGDVFATSSLVGAVVSNELVDALPVHVVEVAGGELREVYVAADAAGRLIGQLGPPSTAELVEYLDRFRVPWRAYDDGWRCEICLAAPLWMREVAETIERGFVLTLDYGDTARRLYRPERRHGTLAVYTRHRHGEQPLAHPGAQDLTAHVNFSALATAGRESGLRLAGFTTQAAFLTRLGIRDEAEALGRRLYPAADAARHTDRGQADHLRSLGLRGAVETLLDPRGLGGFRVLAQQRAVPGVRRALLGFSSAGAAREFG